MQLQCGHQIGRRNELPYVRRGEMENLGMTLELPTSSLLACLPGDRDDLITHITHDAKEGFHGATARPPFGGGLKEDFAQGQRGRVGHLERDEREQG